MRAGGRGGGNPVTEMNSIYLPAQAFLGAKHFLTENTLNMTE